MPDDGPTTLPIVTAVRPIRPSTGGVDLGVVEIDLRRLELSLGQTELGRCAALFRPCVVDGLLSAGGFVNQLLRPPKLDVGVLEHGLGLFDQRLLAIEGRLKGRPLKGVDEIALLDVGTFHEELLVQEASDARHDIDTVDRLDPAVEFVALCHWLVFDGGHADGGWTGRSKLRHRARREENEERREARSNHRAAGQPSPFPARLRAPLGVAADRGRRHDWLRGIS